MKFADVDGVRRQAAPRLSGKCCVCGSTTLAKCGRLRSWHWSHRNLAECDHWWEPEAQWHRDWKNRFPEDWQEIIHWSDAGEKHIADVKTPSGVVIEFQHSFLHPDERRAREAFYEPMVWIVDGTRLKRDQSQFFQNRHALIGTLAGLPIHSLASQDGSLLRDWKNCSVPVYFEFGEGDAFLWRLNPRRERCPATILRMPKEQFVHSHRQGQDFENRITAEIERVAVGQPTPPAAMPLLATGRGFERYPTLQTRPYRRL